MKYYSLIQNHFGRFILLVLIIALSGCTEQKRTILFLGDSLTAGDGVNRKHIFTSLVEKQLNGFQVINQGRPGWSTESYLNKWEEVVKEFPAQAEIVFIQLGSNDLRKHRHVDSTKTICMENMKEILRRTKNQFPGADIVLMSTTKLDPDKINERVREPGFGERANLYLSQIAEGFSMIAADSHNNFVDLNRLVPMGNTHDGAHLNENGHKIVADVILRFMRDLFNSKQESSNSI